MELTAKRTDDSGETAFDRHVDIFVFWNEGKPSFIQFNFHGMQSTDQFFRLIGREDAGMRHRFTMGDTSLDIVRVQTLIKRE